ncbi:MAG TPA: hypothetical protein VK487_06125 [Candidatus Bathyarchaeia archaeon]|nr:hypothetical protein [Candidatus Bathyarchaeia archaeon]
MNFKAVLLMCLLFFAPVITIALVSLSAISSSLKKATFALELGAVQPCGGEPIDDPTPG